MCGIAGFWSPRGREGGLPAILRAMTDAIAHRGPDDEGAYCDESAGLALGHRRLSIVDVSAAGHQPMRSGSGRFELVYNGEIYNFREIRAELQQSGVSFRSGTDTEMILEAVERWGLDAALQRFAGMYAFALWDRERSTLHLCRDRLGEKPLYYGWIGETFAFASELKALRTLPEWRGEIDRDALAVFLRHNYIPAPYSIYRGVKKLLPGAYLSVSEPVPGALPAEKVYWNISDVATRGLASPFDYDDAGLIAACRDLLRATVGEEMVADVPLGAFLSGGVDSSLIVALMQEQSERRVKTFTIGFGVPEYNEADHAKRVARHLGTEHTELYVTPEEARAVIPRLPMLYDEPFADASQIPTFLVAQLARSKVTVSLSGDGGDELFGGYNRYFWGERLWSNMRRVPAPLRRGLSHALRTVSVDGWNGAIAPIQHFIPAKRRLANPGDRLHKLAGILGATTPDDLYRRLVSHWQSPMTVVRRSTELETALERLPPGIDPMVARMMILDQMSYLPDDILVKVDRAAMGVSLETRAPFLDHRVVEFAWRVPLSAKLRDGRGKWLLRQVLDSYVPRSLIERPKMGFGVPIDHWLRHELREWAEDLLEAGRLRHEGFFDAALIRAKWDEHRSGRRNWQYLLWPVLMFQAWLAEERAAAPALRHDTVASSIAVARSLTA